MESNFYRELWFTLRGMERLIGVDRNSLIYRIHRLEEFGEIVVYSPSSQDIEDEKFDFSFSLILITDESKEKVEEIVKAVSDILC